jgi:amino acid adenylation domain-containing protein
VSAPAKFNCVLIGEQSSLIQCAELLLEKGHHLSGIISAEAPIKRWAEENNVPYINPASDLFSQLKQVPFDILFCMANFKPLSENLLALPRNCTINFFDEILPDCADSNATAGRPINGATENGIACHSMASEPNGGDILKQKRFPITEDETSRTLNSKYYEADLKTLGELMDVLAEDRVQPTPQDFSHRTHFSPEKRPVAAGLIDWTRPAKEIDALVRALDFGPHRNPVGSAKMWVDARALIVKQTKVLPGQAAPPAGTITKIENGAIHVATGNGEIALLEFTGPDGKTMPPKNAVEFFGLKQGDTLPSLNTCQANTLTEVCAKLYPSEPFWANRLTDLDSIEIPYAKRTRSKNENGTGSYRELSVSSPQAMLTVKGMESSPGDFLLTAFNLFLSRITGKGTFSIPFRETSMSDLSDATDLIKVLFASHVPLKVDLEDNPKFGDFQIRIQEELNSFKKNGSYALDLINRHPDFGPAVHQWHSDPFSVALERVPQLTAQKPESSVPASGCDLTIVIPDDGLECLWVYHPAVFDEATVRRIQEQFGALLQAITQSPDSPVREFSILPELEKKDLLENWNLTEAEYSADQCVHHLFEEQVQKTPDSLALTFQEDALTYKELNVRANQVAHYLMAKNVGPDDLVAVLLDRSTDMLIAMLGIMKAGGAYLPLDPVYPKDRLAFMVEDAKVSTVITQKKYSTLLPKTSTNKIEIDSEWSQIGKLDSKNPCGKVNAKNLAYVIYTSGSTGKPKGVMVEHSNVVNFFAGMDQCLKGDSPGVWLAVTSLSFDISVLELFWTLTRGFNIVLYAGEDRAIGADNENGHVENSVPALILRHKVTHMQCTPSMAGMLTADPKSHDALRSLRQMLVGGEAFPTKLATELQSLVNGDVINMYGPTETTIWSSTHVLCDSPGTVPIGRPIANTQLYVLDKNFQPVPVGVPGELFIAGDGVVRGYLYRPELTAERFVPNPFSDSSTSRMYRTGDLVRYRPDGILEFLGRMDHQVKIRGHRIELGEIESALSLHAEAKEVVVVAREDSAGNQQLVGYVTPANGKRPQAESLRSFLRARLPEYMVPSVFMVLDSFPLTPNKKVDRKALPAPMQTRQMADGEIFKPNTPTETELLKIWKETLMVEAVGANDSFFDLGGHSLSAVQVTVRVQQIFGVDFPMRLVFQIPVLTELAAKIDALALEQGDLKKPEALPETQPDTLNRYEPFPLTDLQYAYWIGRGTAFEMGGIASNAYVELECRHLDMERLNKAWHTMVKRHDMLRLVVQDDGTQYVLEEAPAYEIGVEDLTGKGSDAVKARLQEIQTEMRTSLREASDWPIFELRVSAISAEIMHLHICLDFLNLDAGSITLLMQELSIVYDDLESTLPPLELNYRDYVLAMGDFKNTGIYDRSRKYWEKRLADFPTAPELPLAKHPGAIERPEFSRRRQVLDKEIWSRIKAGASKRGLTAASLLLTVYSEVLAHWSKNSRLVINIPLFNRLAIHPQVNKVLGAFTSVNLLAVDNSLPDTFSNRVQRLQSQLMDDLDHRHFDGVEVMRELARVKKSQEAASTMPVVFTSLLGHEWETMFSRLGKIAHSVSQTAQVWMDLHVDEQEGALIIKWDAVDELFPNGMVSAMLEAFCNQLKQLTIDESAWDSAERNYLPQDQLDRQSAMNATEGPYPNEVLQTLINEQAVKNGDHLAIVSSERSLTYEEMYRLSNQVGRRLRELGARPNIPVAIVMEKGWEQFVGVLGVLNSGAPYLPIDSEFPSERIHFLIEHSQVELVLTQSKVNDTVDWPENVKRLSVDDASEWTGVDNSPLEPAQTPEDLAYVLYTSGSTGKPKGAMIEHRSVVNRMTEINERFKVTPEDRFMAVTALQHDLSVIDIFATFLAGATVVIPDARDRTDPPHLASLLVREKVTLWNSVPAFVEMLIDHLENTHQKEKMLPTTMRKFMMSGDWIPVKLPDRIRALMPKTDVLAAGGPTETTVWDICYPVTKVDPNWKSIPYGRPMQNAGYYVMNEFLEPCPDWVAGELYISGVGLARGYWGDQQRTAERFITHPRTGERLYKSGDLGRRLPNGNIEFVGRADFQLKVRGYRIEPGEIEAALIQQPSIRDVIVLAVGGTEKDEQVVSYADASSQADAQENSPDEDSSSSEESKYGKGVLTDAMDRLEFKMNRLGLRNVEDEKPRLVLEKNNSEDALRKVALQRQSYRSFTDEMISFKDFSDFLSCLEQPIFDDAPFPKVRYPSAGGLYPVQAYLYIKPDRIEGVEGGTYYYHPGDHRLVHISSNPEIDKTIHTVNNYTVFEQSAFSIFLLGQKSALKPMYGKLTNDFFMLEAGYMGQLLLTAGPDYRLGLCPVGGAEFDRIKEFFGVDEDHSYLHCLIGGRLNPRQLETFAYLDESAATNLMTIPKSKPSGNSTRPTDRRLVAYIVPEPGENIMATEMRKHLRSKVPEYMIPQHFVELEAFPVTANGKVDRNALPSPFHGETAEELEFVEPSTETEKVLAKIWQEVLGIHRVGIHDNFFELGGHSLLSIQVISRIKKATGVRLNVRVLLLNSLGQIAPQCPVASSSPKEQKEQPAAEKPAKKLTPFTARLMQKIKGPFRDNEK